ncbi:MAG: Peptidoglycan-associated lipoprotein precursor [Pseudomonadota bacterium]
MIVSLLSSSRLSRVLPVAAACAVLAACGSSVKLDETPVSDRTGTPVTPIDPNAGRNNTGTAATNRAVEPVSIDPRAMAEPPASVARVVYFDYDSFIVKSEYTSTLEAHARFLKADPSRRVLLQGHTDERGSREYNLALGQKRAEAVRRSLSVLGVSETQQEPVSFGEEKPAASNADETAYAKNRRVELVYR